MTATFLQNIRNKILEYQPIQSCLIYPHPRGEITAPAVFLEIANYEVGIDPATGELALTANLEARVVVDSTIEDAEIACQSLACEIASLIHLNSFGCKVSPAKLSGITRDFFKPDFDTYICWLIEWSHQFHVGSSVWKEIGIPPHTITIGEHIRLRKIAEVKDAQIKVAIGKVITNRLPVLSMAGDTNCWIPISVGEQVMVISPYGEMSQAVVLRSINYNSFPAPANKEEISLNSKNNVKTTGTEKLVVSFDNGIERKSGESDDDLRNRVQIKISGWSSSGSRDAYRFHAMNADTRVRDAREDCRLHCVSHK